MLINHWWNDTHRGETKYSVHHKSNVDCTEIKPGPPRCETATNRLTFINCSLFVMYTKQIHLAQRYVSLIGLHWEYLIIRRKRVSNISWSIAYAYSAPRSLQTRSAVGGMSTSFALVTESEVVPVMF